MRTDMCTERTSLWVYFTYFVKEKHEHLNKCKDTNLYWEYDSLNKIHFCTNVRKTLFEIFLIGYIPKFLISVEIQETEKDSFRPRVELICWTCN
jgi:hypothetical protein